MYISSLFVLIAYLTWASGQNDSLDEARLRSIAKAYQGMVVKEPCDGYHTHICADDSGNAWSETLSDTEVKLLVDDFLTGANVQSLTKAEAKAKMYLDTCLDGKDNAVKLRSDLENLDLFDFDLWPISGRNWSKDHFDWVEIAAKFMSFGKPTAVDVRLEDVGDQKRIALYPKIFDEFEQFAFHSKLDRFLGEYSAKARYSNQVFRNGYLSAQLYATKTEISLNDLKREIPDFNWNKYFQIVFGGKDLYKDYDIFVYNLEELKSLINYINSKDMEMVSYYFLIELIAEYETENAFVQSCFGEFEKFFKDILAYIVLENFINENDAKSQRELFQQYWKGFFKLKLQRNYNKWRHLRKVQESLADIAENRDTFVGVVANYQALKYAKLQIENSNYLQNKINLQKFVTKRKFKNAGSENFYIDYLEENFVKFFRLHHKPMAFYYATLCIDLWHAALREGAEIDAPNRMQCLIEKSLPHPSQRMSEEKFMEFIAARQAFGNFQQWLRWNTGNLAKWQDEILADYRYSNNKLFFHVYMQKRCRTFDVDDYTFIGHSSVFAREYECRRGQRMNYRQKCSEMDMARDEGM